MVVVLVCCDAEFSEAIHMPTFESIQNQGNATSLCHCFETECLTFGRQPPDVSPPGPAGCPPAIFRRIPPNPIRHERKTDCAITRGMCAEMSHIGPKTTPRVRRIFPGESCDPPGKEATSLARGKAVCDGKRPLRRCRRAGRFWKSELARDLRQAVQHGGALGGRKPRKEFFA